MKKLIVILLAMLLVFSMVSCIGDIDIPGGGDDIGGGSGSGSGSGDPGDSGDDPFDPPQWVNPKTPSERLYELTHVEFPENVMYEVKVWNKSAGQDPYIALWYTVWKVGDEVMKCNHEFNEYHERVDVYKYYKLYEQLTGEGIEWMFEYWLQEFENSGVGVPFDFGGNYNDLDTPYEGILWSENDAANYPEKSSSTTDIFGYACTTFKNNETGWHTVPTVIVYETDPGYGIVFQEWTGGSEPDTDNSPPYCCFEITIWDTSVTSFPFEPTLNPKP